MANGEWRMGYSGVQSQLSIIHYPLSIIHAVGGPAGFDQRQFTPLTAPPDPRDDHTDFVEHLHGNGEEKHREGVAGRRDYRADDHVDHDEVRTPLREFRVVED